MASKRCLLAYYSFTGQAARAVEAAKAACAARGWEATPARVDFADPSARLKRPMRLADIQRWTGAAAKGEIAPIALDPPDALAGGFDCVAVFSNTWQDNPSTPIRSLMADARMRAALQGTPFGVYVICRRLWRNNLKIIRDLGEAAGGDFLDGRAFMHPGGDLASLAQTITYLRRADGGRERLLGVTLPPYGLSEDVVESAGAFTASMLAAAEAKRAPARAGSS